ncbi:two-component system capsular synthesis sensor histidine kinase RcsC [Burkholderia pyrrocinia]|uniref:Virulence sensor protein BvgS n=2 Tax=Burkholderiaceae TaxID=119060 RepID=A0A318I589_BURPY|nr:two-component system capsular synthesis sensor histidine kinase RcsC [Burkholderia pyrrocinia]SFW13067.1 two-component system, NarL family, capsular synthesis sensor histidine kinase RcsC [Burkholderia sp. NFACC33-1]SFX00557.1 two-component system, NarL family, capsular synthesis sensor histidine kinase RcsC [Burkholderia sp. NFPP32]
MQHGNWSDSIIMAEPWPTAPFPMDHRAAPDRPHPTARAAPPSHAPVGRRQRALLYGGGIAVTIAILLASGLMLYAVAKEVIQERYTAFAVRHFLVQFEFKLRMTGMVSLVTHDEAFRETRVTDPALVAGLDTGHGRLELKGSDRIPSMLVLADLSPQRPAESYGRDLAMASDLTYRVGAYLANHDADRAVAGYVYRPDRSFALVIPAPAADSPTAGTAGASALLAQVAAGLEPPAAGRFVWHAPAYDPVQRRDVFRLVGAAYAGGQPFEVLVSTLPVDVLRTRLTTEYATNGAIVADAQGNTLLRTGAAASDAATLATLKDLATHTRATTGSGPRTAYGGGLFALSQPIPDTDWTIVQAFTLRSLVAAVGLQAGWYVVVMLAALVLVWGLLVLFDRRVLKPDDARTRRVVESENLNRTIVEAAPSGIALLSLADGAVLLQNDTMRAYDARIAAAPSLAARLLARFDASPGASAWQSDLHVTLPAGGGETVDLLVNLVRTRYRDTDVVLCNFSDITSQKNIERKLDEALRAADAANDAKSAFLATMSHEIRTPLNAILGNLELIGREPLADTQRERLQTVEGASSVLLNLISDILDLSKIEAGQMTIEAIPFDLAEAIEQTGAMFEPLATAKGLQYDVIVDDALASRYVGDPVRIRQIAANLVGNAIKFTDRGDVTLEVYLRDDADPASPVVIGVSDTGIGMTDAQRAALFRPFTQADTSITRRYGGTGLGLALTKHLTQMMHGAIDVKSAPGEGSTFVVTLPLRAATDAEIARHRAETADADAALPALAARVLVVDDHPVNRTLQQSQLVTLGYAADAADDGASALRRCADTRYDLVMTDLNMPGMDGYALARVLRARYPDLPVIAITAHASAAEHARCAEAGIVAVLVKPVLLDTIDRTVRRFATVAAASRPERNTLVDLAEGPLPPDVHALFSDTLDRSLAAIRDALARGDVPALRAELHSLRGAFATIHEHAVADAVRDMQDAVQAGDPAALEPLVDRTERLARDTLWRRAAQAPQT